VASTASAIDVQIAPIGDLVTSRLTKSGALLLFAFVVVAWGLNWTVTKLIVMLTGFAVMFNPSAFDWADHDAALGNVLLLLSALAWSVSILYTRAHHWLAPPFQLVFWQALLATVVLTILALILEGELHIRWSNPLVMWFAYSGVVGTALGFLAMTVVGRSVPATTTSLGILATPVVGIGSSAAFLGEQVDWLLLIAATMIIAGIAIGTFNSRAS